MNPVAIPSFLRDRYEIHEWRHAIAILKSDFPSEWDDVVATLTDFRLHRSQIAAPGGGKTAVGRGLDAAFTFRGWCEKKFATKIVIDSAIREWPTLKVDCFKNRIGLEIEWNNKDPFYDRDLNNFRLLFDLRALDVGIIVTRSDELQHIFDQLGLGRKYGPSKSYRCRLSTSRATSRTKLSGARMRPRRTTFRNTFYPFGCKLAFTL